MNWKNLIISDGDSELEVFINDSDKLLIKITDSSGELMQCVEIEKEDTDTLIKELKILSKQII